MQLITTLFTAAAMLAAPIFSSQPDMISGPAVVPANGTVIMPGMNDSNAAMMPMDNSTAAIRNDVIGIPSASNAVDSSQDLLNNAGSKPSPVSGVAPLMGSAAAAAPIAMFDKFGMVHASGVPSNEPGKVVVPLGTTNTGTINNATMTNDNANTMALATNSSTMPVAMPMVTGGRRRRQAPGDTLVSTDVGSQQLNRSFATGNGPIVAILPSGSNLSATWNLNTGVKPTVMFMPLSQFTTSTVMSVVPVAAVAVPVAAVAVPAVFESSQRVAMASSSTTTTTTTTTQMPVAMANSSAVAGDFPPAPVILPVGVTPQSLPANDAPVLAAAGGAVMANHRVEIQLLDFQMNNSANSDINQGIALNVDVVAGSMPPSVVAAPNAGLVPVSPATQVPLMANPQTTSGLQQVFNGTYRTSASNKISIDRTLTVDLCGQIPDKAIMDVTIGPMNAGDASLPSQTYKCMVNLNFPTPARSSESFWSDILQCNSGDAPEYSAAMMNGYSFRLWYKVRQYNIDWAQCQQHRPNM